MTELSLSQQIIAEHSLDPTPVIAGTNQRISVDWVMASELALGGMVATLERIGNPPLFDSDRFFLAIDHTVDPVSEAQSPDVRRLINLSRVFAKRHNLSAFYDTYQTIMHTRFYRDHALPGDIILGADSHTTSHGALGAFAFGLGGADVAIAAVSGSTWIEVPKAIRIEMKGTPSFGISGKDLALRVISEIGCGRTANGRSVEFFLDDPGVISTDSRFTLCNMATEMGAVNGIFAPSDETESFLTHRQRSGGTRSTHVLQLPGRGAYEDVFSIDMRKLTPRLARPFSPDNVDSVASHAGMAVDGCFIGSCTTTEEELVMAGLVLEVALNAGIVPTTRGKRLVVMGDTEMQRRLSDIGLLKVFEQAGFRILKPGCHMCLGMGSVRASEGEVWLSSQNRNFHNRMGKGSIAWLASAATVAASAVNMEITDPRALLGRIDRDRAARLQSRNNFLQPPNPIRTMSNRMRVQRSESIQRSYGSLDPGGTICGRVQKFGDNVDTDAIIPGEFCKHSDSKLLGEKCFAYVRPEMPEKTDNGYSIVVAGEAWGCGSSREHAAWALSGAGVRLVVAKSFAPIHRRNLVNEGIPSMTVSDAGFFDLVDEGNALVVDLTTAQIVHLPTKKTFQGELPSGQAGLLLSEGGLVASYLKNKIDGTGPSDNVRVGIE